MAILTSIKIPSNQDIKYVKQTQIELTGETDKSTITVGHVNTPLSTVDRQKIKKGIEELNSSINQQGLIDI